MSKNIWERKFIKQEISDDFESEIFFTSRRKKLDRVDVPSRLTISKKYLIKVNLRGKICQFPIILGKIKLVLSGNEHLEVLNNDEQVISGTTEGSFKNNQNTFSF